MGDRNQNSHQLWQVGTYWEGAGGIFGGMVEILDYFALGDDHRYKHMYRNVLSYLLMVCVLYFL